MPELALLREKKLVVKWLAFLLIACETFAILAHLQTIVVQNIVLGGEGSNKTVGTSDNRTDTNQVILDISVTNSSTNIINATISSKEPSIMDPAILLFLQVSN